MGDNTASDFRQWLGKTEQYDDVVLPQPAIALAATLDKLDFNADTGQPLPPAWHWIYFQTCAPASELGPDGHPHRGEFLPPIPLPRRMWAGSHFNFHQPVFIGDKLQRRSTIADVTLKQGRSGQLAFVKVHHAYLRDSVCILEEEHDIVYREAATPGAASTKTANAPEMHQWSRTIRPDPVLLFRYSALTFNGHRIHYDRSYCQEVEGYPGLVVHGPLIATLLLDLLSTSQPRPIKEFSFRALSPLFDTDDFTINGCSLDEHRVELWAANQQGQLCMQATAQLSQEDEA